MKLALHYTYTFAGDVQQPSFMTIIHEKLDLVERLNKLIDGRVAQSESVEQIREMIKIEMAAIYEMIQVDKQEKET